jgi:undecaprenyl-diphosphatase
MRAFLRRRLSREEAVGLSFTLSFLACAGLAVAIGWLALEVRSEGSRFARLDLFVGGALAASRTGHLSAAMEVLTQLGDFRFLGLATPAVALTLWFSGHHVSALLFAGSVVGGFGLSTLVKLAVARARPDLWVALVSETSYSFPSGHTVMATVFFGGLAAIVFHLSKSRLLRAFAAAGAFAAAFAVAVTRIYLGAHWTTDTIAGMLTGLIWVLVFSTATEAVTRTNGGARLWPRDFRPPRSVSR